MHIVKYNQIRKNLRKEHINNTIQQLRHAQLTHLSQHHEGHQHPNSPYQDFLNSDGQNLLSNQASPQQFQAKLVALLQTFKVLLENRQKLEKQECANTSQFSTLLADFRKLIFQGRGLINLFNVRDIYNYMKFRNIKGFASLECENGDLQNQTHWENIQRNRHHLHLTSIILLSEYLNQGGPLTLSHLQLNKSKSEQAEQFQFSKWMIAEYSNWKAQCEQQLSKAIEMIEDYHENKIEEWKVRMQLLCIKYYLMEQHNLIKVMLYYKTINRDDELKAIMNYKKVRLLLKLIKSYLCTDQLKYITLDIFSEVVAQQNSASFIKILQQNDFLQTVRYQFFIYHDYKNITSKTKMGQKQKYSFNIISIIIYILSCISIKQSDLLWSQGILYEVKATINEIRLPHLKQNFISLVLQSIITAQQPQKIYQWSDLMDWVVNIIEGRIQEEIVSEEKQDDLIRQCLEVLKYFFQIGQYQRKTKKLNANPYHIKFYYLHGSQILSKSLQCQRFLDQELADQREYSL